LLKSAHFSFFFCSAACKWLGAFLRNSSGGAVIVSHDQDLLQDACDQIVEVRGRQLHHYAGDYNLFLEQRELRSQQAASAALTQGKKIAELEGFVARFGAKASKASQAQSRAKQLEKIKSNMVAAPAASAGDGPGDARKVTNSWPLLLFNGIIALGCSHALLQCNQHAKLAHLFGPSSSSVIVLAQGCHEVYTQRQQGFWHD